MSGPPKTVEQVLALHPWSTEHGSAPRLEWLWHFEVALTVDQRWPIIADSSRMNRALGVAQMKFEDRDGVRFGASRPGGVAHEWVEVPWNWVAGQWVESTRIYQRGFSKVVYAVFLLEALTPERTRLSVYFGATRRSCCSYAERGDPAAFMEVKNHFGEVFPVVARHRGAVVKTIGDAVMAAFSDPLDAVKASRDIHACFPPGRKDTGTRLRISLNSGPCIAVKLNTGVDYFGQTVNLAAKLQSLAESWQVAMSEAVLRAPGVASWLEKESVELEDLSFSSKALREPLPVKRWTCFVE